MTTFLLKNLRTTVPRRKFISRAGLMQLIVTNIGIWSRALILETLDDLVSAPTRHTRDSDNSSNIELMELG